MKFKIGLVAASLFGAIAASPAASAMPIAPAPATPQVSDVEQVRMVCNAMGALLVAAELRLWITATARDIMGRRDITAARYYGPRYYGPRYRRW